MAIDKNDPARHIRKRQYQRPITSFFHRDADPSRPVRVVSPLSPPLPADTQASLLSVGMRVRKSVPEGYKTHKTLGTAGFPFPSSAPAAISTADLESSNVSASRELAPFCGLHKVGGWAEQHPSFAPAVFELDHENTMPELSMSQSTLYSSQGSFMTAEYAGAGLGRMKKRRYEDDTEADMDAIFDELGDMEEERVRARVIAQPRSSSKRATADGVHRGASGDFEEAPFLAIEGMNVDEAWW